MARARRNPYRTNTGIHIKWFTVRRSSIYWLLLLIAVILGAGGSIVYSIYGPKQEPAVAQASPVVQDTARFLGLRGAVKVRKAGTYEWMDANMAMALNRDDTIRTAGSASASIRLFDGTEYFLKESSILVIERAYEDPDTKAKVSAVKLDVGQVTIDTPRHDVPGSRSDVQTPTSAASIDGNTRADVGFDGSSRRSVFTVIRGGSTVRSGENQITLREAQAVNVSADNRFSDVIDLPGVPVLETPANMSVVGITPTVEFRWRPVERARKYHVVLGRSPSFPDPILESSVSRVSVLHQGLEPGTYYWQVTPIDSENRRGVPSDFARFTVTSRPQTGQPPELTVYSPSVTLDGLVTVQGKTDLNAVVTVDRGMGDDRVNVKSDGTFTYYFELQQVGRHAVVVKSRKRDGGVAEKTVYAEIGTD